MSANLSLLVLIGILVAGGVYLMLERTVTKMLLGMMLFGNGVNLLILTVGGPDGAPPLVGRSSLHERMADPLAQAMILTAIVITMGIAAFVLALAYRSFMLTTKDRVENDPEDVKVLRRTSRAEAPDQDRSEDPVTGAMRITGDAFDAHGNPIPVTELQNLEDIEYYEGVESYESAEPT
ncbi:Na(+)/H(+) antiporter subunit C [Skermania sp. ID1734]|uniref:Na(+)/H(+) antiporter subunit C n=1 Tax=Skermania sp. ID1734 TaxID=2597516 RepID=UPI00118152FA|nr:Na(+)/H(+) antiporter subunit C [Skermania sp. ID1734]TSD99415.1 Na(+)/H(+) antiporter subunit C [Skermania sp. ID1734]